VPPGLDALVQRLLEPDPADRHHTAAGLLTAIDGLLAGERDERPPGERELDRIRQLRQTGELREAAALAERTLDGRPGPMPATRLALLRQLAAVQTALGAHDVAAGRLAEAWELVDGSALLPRRAERAALLGEVTEAFTQARNAFQAGRYAALRRAENEQR
jgi:hypothetical protein